MFYGIFVKYVKYVIYSFYFIKLFYFSFLCLFVYMFNKMKQINEWIKKVFSGFS